MPDEEPDSNQIDDPEQYEELKEQKGVNKEEAARKADSERVGAEDEEDTPTYEKWTDKELEKKVREEGIEGYAGMDREHLIGALRDKETQTK